MEEIISPGMALNFSSLIWKGSFHSTKVMVENTPWLKSKQLKYQTPWRLNNYYSLLYEEYFRES